jgi:serine/threonine protein phosphatase PrpC
MNFFQRLFSQPKVGPEIYPQASPVAVVASNSDQSEPPTLNQLAHLAPGLHLGSLSHVGRERECNEDSFYVFESTVNHHYDQENFALLIIADGMGGHQNGEIASALAIRTAAGTILEDVYLPYLTHRPSANNQTLNEVLLLAVAKANGAVQTEVPEGGTTLTIVVLMGNNAYIAHVGDTRVYIFQQGQLKQVTKDHSLAQRLEDMGQATAEEAHQVQNVLYKAIGQNDTPEADLYVQHLTAGASLLMCSDGLWGLVKQENIKEILAQAASPQAACEQLIQMANENGGRDNITALIVSRGVEEKRNDE